MVREKIRKGGGGATTTREGKAGFLRSNLLFKILLGKLEIAAEFFDF